MSAVDARARGEQVVALVPTRELHEAVRALGVPAGVALLCDEEPHGRDAEVTAWVAPYATAGALTEVERFSALRLVQLQSAGYDGLPGLVPPGAVLANASGVHDAATAEHAVGLVLASLRGIPEAVHAQADATWRPMPGRRALADSSVLVLGAGSIGRALARRLLALEARVTGVASRARADEVLGQVHGPESLPDLLPHQHVVVVLLPLTDDTRGTVDDAFLAQLPDDALVVNVARGAVVDTDAVLAHAGRLRFALDVTDPEPLPDGHPLWSAPGVLVTPHVAGGTTAMLPRMAALVHDQLGRLAAGDPPAHVVARG
ncbi:NAD(P)-dependent oxidoreductase [Nocardioides perillae]|uniref:Phosphoglycerate dehydrogenase-like enzyme n=1 Tax=Nocardioides perillae TaxID=1119534 RepID=A0A7Y9UJT8_9ACTN|nr:phosphoglycerate dehydrogenase-like enzyme [Nocardioides perillae]